jgi:hypothetical protein
MDFTNFMIFKFVKSVKSVAFLFWEQFPMRHVAHPMTHENGCRMQADMLPLLSCILEPVTCIVQPELFSEQNLVC